MAVPLMLDLYSVGMPYKPFPFLVLSFNFNSISNLMVNFYSLQKLVKSFRFGLLEIVVNTNNRVERKK